METKKYWCWLRTEDILLMYDKCHAISLIDNPNEEDKNKSSNWEWLAMITIYDEKSWTVEHQLSCTKDGVFMQNVEKTCCELDDCYYFFYMLDMLLKYRKDGFKYLSCVPK